MCSGCCWAVVLVGGVGLVGGGGLVVGGGVVVVLVVVLGNGNVPEIKQITENV